MDELNTENEWKRFKSNVNLDREDLEKLARPYTFHLIKNRDPKLPRDFRGVHQFCLTQTAKYFQQYIELFGQGGLPRKNDRGRYLIESVNVWTTVPHQPPYKKFVDHLLGKRSLALRGSYYPKFCAIDLDDVGERPYEAIHTLASRLGLDDDQYAAFTSPSAYNRQSGHRGVHIYLRPTLHEETPTIVPMLACMESIIRHRNVNEILGRALEIYPQLNHALRIPFGHHQNYVDLNEREVVKLPWQICLEKFLQLREFRLYLVHFVNSPRGPRNNDVSEQKQEAERLLDTGLVSPGTRNHVTGVLARYFYFRGTSSEEAINHIKQFMREKNNGLSHEINIGNWDKVDREIDSWVRSTSERYSRNILTPEVRTFRGAWVTENDIREIIRLIPGDYKNQKRLFKLTLYFRASDTDGFLHMRNEKWRKFSKSGQVKQFRELLTEKGILVTNNAYSSGYYSKSYKLTFLRPANEDEKLKDQDDSPITEYKDALMAVLGSVDEVVAATGVNPKTLRYRRRQLLEEDEA